MKKTLIGLIILTMFSCSTTTKVKKNNSGYINDTTYYKGTSGIFDSVQIGFLKNNYNWNSKKILIVNFKESKSNCESAGYIFGVDSFKSSQKKWDKTYSTIDLKDCSNIFVYSETKGIEKYIDNVKYFKDKDNFFLENIFNKRKGCNEIIIINENGKYLFHNWHYSEREITKYIEYLK